ncbi:MAG: radical SAM protein [Candidatus Baldrarchaeia archaeon]
MLVFGPVPSRRLGRSLGVNNIPAKICSYSCVYCQLGATIKISTKRRQFYNPEKIFKEVKEKIKKVELDFISFVPDGEPTLDINLGKEIEMLKSLNHKIAVLTNGSLVFREDVRKDLSKANLVSLKVDAVSEDLWRKINRPHPSLSLQKILEGMIDFSKEFKGKLITETMLIDQINYKNEFDEIADFLKELNPKIAYVAIPTRPPAEKWVKPPHEETINEAFQTFSQKIRNVEYLIGYEGTAFSFSGNVEKDLLSITAVHPMREDAVKELLNKAGVGWGVVEKLIDEGKLIELKYREHKFYMRRLPGRH